MSDYCDVEVAVDATIRVTVHAECGSCGEDLDVSLRSQGDDITATVEPCTKCADDSFSEGKELGAMKAEEEERRER